MSEVKDQYGYWLVLWLGKTIVLQFSISSQSTKSVLVGDRVEIGSVPLSPAVWNWRWFDSLGPVYLSSPSWSRWVPLHPSAESSVSIFHGRSRDRVPVCGTREEVGRCWATCNAQVLQVVSAVIDALLVFGRKNFLIFQDWTRMWDLRWSLFPRAKWKSCGLCFKVAVTLGVGTRGLDRVGKEREGRVYSSAAVAICLPSFHLVQFELRRGT